MVSAVCFFKFGQGGPTCFLLFVNFAVFLRDGQISLLDDIQQSLHFLLSRPPLLVGSFSCEKVQRGCLPGAREGVDARKLRRQFLYHFFLS